MHNTRNQNERPRMTSARSGPQELLEPPPDGGFRAWMSVLSGFFIIMNTWGVFISFGVFQTYYASALGRAPSDISWIGSFQIFLLFFTGSIAGSLSDAGYFRSVVVAGAALIVLGTFMTSISRTYWQIFLTQGLCLGLGNGLVFTPIVAVITTYFEKRRSLALAIAACGSTVGGLIFPSMARNLLPSIGFGWTMRSIGFIQLGTMAAAVVSVKPKIVGHKKGPLIDWRIFKDCEFSLFTIGAFLTFTGVFFPFFYLSTYSRNAQGLSYTESLNLLLVLNGVGIVGRLWPSLGALWLGPFNIFTMLVTTTSLIIYLWSTVFSLTGLYIWTVFFSLAMGGIQSMYPAALATLKFDPEKQGMRMGMASAVISFGVLIGPPVSGVLVSRGGETYLGAQIFAGSCMAAGAVVLILAGQVKRRHESRSLISRF